MTAKFLSVSARLKLSAVTGTVSAARTTPVARLSNGMLRINLVFMVTSWSSLQLFDARQLPRLVEQRLLGAVKAERREPRLVVGGIDPVCLLPRRRLRAEEHV